MPVKWTVRGPPSPVGDTVVTIVVQGVVFGALPGDGGLGAATNSTSQNNGLPHLTRDLAQGNDEFWGNCTRKESSEAGYPWPPSHASLTNGRDPRAAKLRASQKTHFHRLRVSAPKHIP